MTGPIRPQIPQEDATDHDDLEVRRPNPELRQTLLTVVVTVLIAAVLLVGGVQTAGGLHTALIIAASGVIFLGGLYAAIRAYRSSREGGRWQVWQGGMWFLWMLFLLWGPSAGTFVILGD